MNNKKHDENYYRTLAFKFFDKEKTTKQILEIIPRSRSWLFKWKSRFAKEGWAAAASSNHRPRSSPQAYPKRARETVLKMRVRMQNAKVGLIGARFIHCELQHRRLLRDVPSLSTIKRWLREEGFFEKKENQERKVYYPKMCFSDSVCYASSDWIVRYIRGGEKVFVFHTIEMKSHALSQSIERNKRADTACAHFLKSMMELGLIDVLQVDNDAAFTGLGIKPRIFGSFVRVALYFGVELIFIPPGEAKRNGVVERVNGLWATAFWDRNNFTSVKEVRRKKGQFFTWYMKYAPPSLNGLRIKDECEKVSGRKFSKIECEELPDKLPLTVGRIHYVRKVDERGSIDILKEKFRISKSLRGKYVVATIDFSDESLTIHHRGSEKSKAKLLKKFDYKIEEPIVKLKSKYRRGKKKRVNILEIL
jgi:transposase